MIKVTLRNIKDYELPLDNTSKVLSKGTSEKVLKELEKEYGEKTHRLCSKNSQLGYPIYVNPTYDYILEEDKYKWITNYEVYIRSSFVYKFWIWLYKIKKKTE